MSPLAILALLEGILSLWPKAQAVADELHRTGQWTDDEYARWKQRAEGIMASPAWQPEAPEPDGP